MHSTYMLKACQPLEPIFYKDKGGKRKCMKVSPYVNNSNTAKNTSTRTCLKQTYEYSPSPPLGQAFQLFCSNVNMTLHTTSSAILSIQHTVVDIALVHRAICG